jgi:hypothetical protein
MQLAVAEKRGSKPVSEPQAASRLNPLETKGIDLFVQLSRLLGHPCKIYNILSVGAPVLYIGPQPSHLSEILMAIGKDSPCSSAAHGEVDRVVQQIVRLRREAAATRHRALAHAGSPFSKEALLPKLIAELEPTRIGGSRPASIA